MDGVAERKLAWCWLPGLAVVVDETAKGLEDAGDGGGVHGLPRDAGKELEGFGVGCCIQGDGGGVGRLGHLVVLMVDEDKGGLYLEGGGGRKGFADGEVEATFGLRLVAPEAGRARSSPEPAEGILFEVEAGEGKAVSVLDVGREASGDATVGSEAYTFEMCPLPRGHGREVLLEVREEAKPVDRCLCMFFPEGGSTEDGLEPVTGFKRFSSLSTAPSIIQGILGYQISSILSTKKSWQCFLSPFLPLLLLSAAARTTDTERGQTLSTHERTTSAAPRTKKRPRSSALCFLPI